MPVRVPPKSVPSEFVRFEFVPPKSVPPRSDGRRRRGDRRVHRRLAVAAVLTCLAVAALAVVAPTAAVSAPAAARPNIVFVLTDDLDTSLLQYLPHVRELARRGTSFDDFIVSDSYCCPSRASIFTGEYPHNTGVRTNEGDDGGFGTFHRLGDENRTFAVGLQGAGYRTAFLGKYLNGYNATGRVPYVDGSGGDHYVPPGWDEWFGVGNGYPEYHYTANHNGVEEVHGTAPEDYLTTVMQGHADTFLTAATRSDAPFLLEVAAFTPHRPAEPAPQDVGSLPGVTAPRGPEWNTLPTDPPAWLAGRRSIGPDAAATIDAAARKRAESVQSVDRLVGHLQDTLRATGDLANTVFVFTSDNGYHLGQHRLTAGKLTAFDTDIRVPFIVAGPGIPAGATTDLLAQNVDIAPTFQQLAGVPVPATVDGHSLVDVLHGTAPASWRERAFVEHRGPAAGDGGDDPAVDPDAQSYAEGIPPPYEAIRTAHHLYVEYVDGEREYYDLDADPHELHNLAGSLSASKLQSLAADVAALKACGGASCWAASRG